MIHVFGGWLLIDEWWVMAYGRWLMNGYDVDAEGGIGAGAGNGACVCAGDDEGADDDIGDEVTDYDGDGGDDDNA